MSAHTVSRGLDVPITGVPSQVIHAARDVSKVGLLPPDARGVRPRLMVQVGDTVRAGQPIYQDRRDERLRVTAPVAGRVEAIHRGDRRVIQSVMLDVSPPDFSDAVAPFASWSHSIGRDPAKLRALLLESGLWTALRTRPFSEVPSPDATPHALFVTAMDTQPLAPHVDVIIAERSEDFARGLEALVALTDAPVYLCRALGSHSGDGVKGVHVAEFTGKHPAGTVGYHIHRLAPVSREHVAWHLGAQDVMRFGALLRTGHLDATQVVSLGGPLVREPRLLRTVLGANVRELLHGELNAGDTHAASSNGHGATRDHRIISGSVLTGRQVDDDITGYLGRFHQQISVIPESRASAFLGWMLPASRSYTYLPVFLASWARQRERAFDTRLHGGRRAMVPIGLYEEVMPMDLMPTHLLRAISVGDAEWAESLGVLELDEEDVALCTFVCPSKYEYGAALRRVLDLIASER
ncbi:Na(+)-translocating NADH-quinone reductase subunit A [Gemmatimonas sp.]|uniref:Na(+)-translocating NADH-quinone reductase subunit A n=1 Tax=Gemmatimonas sp. TaxID=1962908 RepID=UPI0035650E39